MIFLPAGKFGRGNQSDESRNIDIPHAQRDGSLNIVILHDRFRRVVPGETLVLGYQPYPCYLSAHLRPRAISFRSAGVHGTAECGSGSNDRERSTPA